MITQLPMTPRPAPPIALAEGLPPRPPRPRKDSGAPLRVGLLNNMPDSAFLQTERQFRRLLGDDCAVELFVFETVPRGDAIRDQIVRRYQPHRALPEAGLDALVITGCEPRASKIDQEPYYPAFAELVDWARTETVSTLFSCLAAHAAVLHLDGIERTPLPAKLSGVFTCETIGSHPLLGGMRDAVPVPHSRLNEVSEAKLQRSGYSILRRSDAIGADLFVRDLGSLFVFLHGHPEYERDSLAREYRRDVGRYLDGQRDIYPSLPHDIYPRRSIKRFEDFAAQAVLDRASLSMEAFPSLENAPPLPAAWQEDALRLFRNWLLIVERRRASAGLPKAASAAGVERSAL